MQLIASSAWFDLIQSEVRHWHRDEPRLPAHVLAAQPWDYVPLIGGMDGEPAVCSSMSPEAVDLAGRYRHAAGRFSAAQRALVAVDANATEASIAAFRECASALQVLDGGKLPTDLCLETRLDALRHLANLEANVGDGRDAWRTRAESLTADEVRQLSVTLECLVRCLRDHARRAG